MSKSTISTFKLFEMFPNEEVVMYINPSKVGDAGPRERR